MADWKTGVWVSGMSIQGLWCFFKKPLHQGRINKDPDTCYSFWVGSSLTMLDAIHLANHPLSKSFTYSCKTKYGGFSKVWSLVFFYMLMACLAVMSSAQTLTLIFCTPTSPCVAWAWWANPALGKPPPSPFTVENRRSPLPQVPWTVALAWLCVRKRALLASCSLRGSGATKKNKGCNHVNIHKCFKLDK